jgi:DNA-binding transcriptional ArsR family regulator
MMAGLHGFLGEILGLISRIDFIRAKFKLTQPTLASHMQTLVETHLLTSKKDKKRGQVGSFMEWY